MTTEIEFEGSCHPPGQENHYDGTFLTKENMEEKIKDLIGTPVLCEHKGKQLGKITGANIDERNRLIVKGKIDRGTWEGIQAVSSLRNGNRQGLSLGMEHLVEVSPDWMKIIDKTINEVSITSNPDLPETEIYYVQPDSDHWNLAKNVLRGNWQNEKLKKNIYKAKSDLIELTNQIVNTSVMENQTNTPSQTATATTTTPTLENETFNGSSIEEVNTLKEALINLQQENQKLQQQDTEYNELLKEISQNPLEYKKLMDEKKQKLIKMQEAMQSQAGDIEDFITHNFLMQGQSVPKELKDLPKTGPNLPEQFKPLFKLLTVAHANQKQSQKENEEKYQMMKKQMSDQIQQEKNKYIQLNDEYNKVSKEYSYKSRIASHPYMKQNEQPKHNNQNQTSTQVHSHKDEFNDRWQVPQKIDIDHKGTIIGPSKGVGLQETPFFAELFGGGIPEINSGMDLINMKGIVGYNYPLAKEGINPETGEITGFTIRGDPRTHLV